MEACVSAEECQFTKFIRAVPESRAPVKSGIQATINLIIKKQGQTTTKFVSGTFVLERTIL